MNATGRAAVGVVLVHLLGCALRAALQGTLLGDRRSVGDRFATLIAALAEPWSTLLGLATLHALSNGVTFFPALLALFGVLASDGSVPERRPSRALAASFAAVVVVVFLRPMTPTFWDEFVWLGKARLEYFSFGGSVSAALDPRAHLLPPGYPTLWPAAAAWFALRADDLACLTAGASAFVALAATTFLAAAARTVPPMTRRDAVVAASLVLAAPLVLVHARSVYVDLPLGLLGAALLLTFTREGASSTQAAVLALLTVSLKDEGLAHLACAVVGAVIVGRPGPRLSRAVLAAAAVGALTFATWQLRVSFADIPREHAGFAPHFAWILPFLPRALAHATEVMSWGVFWPAVLVVAGFAYREAAVRSAATALLLHAAFVATMLVLGPPRVRAFAEAGTLLGRVLVQLWPLGVVVLLMGFRSSSTATSAIDRPKSTSQVSATR